MAKKQFFNIMERQRIALTFRDVRLKTGHCSFRPNEISLETRFSRNVGLHIPIVSAAMDTVTESEMAIALAKLGGLGVIHYNLSPEDQAAEAKRVWHHLNGRIERPRTVRANATILEVERERKDHGWTFHSFPVLDTEDRVVGLLTRNDFDFCERKSSRVSEVMTKDLVTARPGTTIDQAYKIMRREKKKVLPLVDKGRRLVGMYIFSDVQRIKTGSSSMYNLDEHGHLRCAAAVGIDDDAFERIELLSKYVSVILINKAHADFSDYIRTLREIKKKSWPFDVATGNVSEPGSAKRLVNAGSDCILVGQGGGSICTTRPVAGVGCPQVTAVYNCARAIEGSGVPICADGGIVFSGDIPIAIGAGAHSVMLGFALAGTKESPGEIKTQEVTVRGASGETIRQTIQVKVYRGMGSLEAMQEREGSSARYRQAELAVKVPEGIKGVVPYKGEVATQVYYLVGGLRARKAYVGARTILKLIKKADFHRITNAGMAESNPHDVIMLSEPPNFQRSGT